MAVRCGVCGELNSQVLRPESTYIEIDQISYCRFCVAEVIQEKIKFIKATTTNSFDGYYIEEYLDIESVEVVPGTGIFSEMFADVDDFLGSNVTSFEKKLRKAKKAALDRLKMLAYNIGGNAVVGVDIDYTEFSSNRVGVVVNGTIVRLKPNDELNS